MATTKSVKPFSVSNVNLLHRFACNYNRKGGDTPVHTDSGTASPDLATVDAVSASPSEPLTAAKPIGKALPQSDVSCQFFY